MSRTTKEKAVENEELELNAKKIMKFLLDHEVHLPSTYDSERKIINLCVKNLKANDLDVEQTKSTLLERYKEPREKKKSGRKRSADTILGGLVKKRRKKRATSTPKIEIVRNEANRPIVEMINEMSERYFVSGDQNRGAAYALASKILRDTEHKVESRDLEKYHGIGKHINDHIHEFLSTGKVERLEELRNIT
eukprot:gene7489-8078_t